jgi:hypothetical protein
LGLFRRHHETLNEKLLREAGVDPGQALGDSPPPGPLMPPKSTLATLGLPDGSGVGPKAWDGAATVAVPALAGDRIEFATLPNGDVIVGEETGDADLSPLADAIERHVDPPYRAVAARQDGHLWAVAAKQIEVAKIPFPQGDKLELFRNGENEELRVDGEPSDEAAPRELERIGQAAGTGFYVEAERVDGDLWEVRATAL